MENHLKSFIDSNIVRFVLEFYQTKFLTLNNEITFGKVNIKNKWISHKKSET